jgi:N-acetylglucosamine kinase-like BadF-type ATPase
LIADAGSTKTHWGWSEGQPHAQYHHLETPGLNPQYLDEAALGAALDQRLALLPKSVFAAKHLYFYGAGCVGEAAKSLQNSLQQRFAQADVQVQSDILAACRALCGDEPGIVAILGTGANSCHYDGRLLADQVPPLGYALGDEGSAAHLGKLLLQGYFYREMPPDLREAFGQQIGNREEVLRRVYRSEAPNQYVASLSAFIAQYPDHPYLHHLVAQNFDAFVRRQLAHYPMALPVHACGGLVAALEKQWYLALQRAGRQPGHVVQRPLERLVRYHDERL